ncbi:thiolase family protein [Luteolibacter marinus]|uniref:thiolase family protein n=1 Tax=Luteolibacter marinus TaxID=2776705 RepID=UPI0018684B91|nr:thiolase family protein [Luteolibacter marinus]
MSDLHIIAGIRTPFCRLGTDFDGLGADDLGRLACASLLLRTGIDPSLIDEVIFGCVAQPVDAANVARVIALRAGVPPAVPAVTVHRNCASGMESITTAHQRLLAGQGELFLVGGAESMSSVPLYYPHSANAKFNALSRAKDIGQKITAVADFRPADFKPGIGLALGLTDPFSGMIMGDTAEVLAREFQITREEQDAFAADSHRKSLAAAEALAGEIAPVILPGNAVTGDNGIRDDSTPDKLAKLRPIFDRHTGTVTAGNSSQITDGAVALLVGSERMAGRLGIEPLGRLTSYAYAGCDPKRMGLGPVHAIARCGRSPEEADLVEINEAFAAQVLAVLAALRDPRRCALEMPPAEIPSEKLNRLGGAIALGHPVGATGARLVLTALQQLRQSGGKTALTTLCVGGGQGAALWLERH